MNKRILIIGGMGPQASLKLHQHIINRAVENGAIHGSDFPEIIHISLPVDDFISDSNKTSKALSLIKRRLYCLWPGKVYSYNNCM